MVLAHRFIHKVHICTVQVSSNVPSLVAAPLCSQSCDRCLNPANPRTNHTSANSCFVSLPVAIVLFFMLPLLWKINLPNPCWQRHPSVSASLRRGFAAWIQGGQCEIGAELATGSRCCNEGRGEGGCAALWEDIFECSSRV